jgi:hypothetical protein
MICLILKLREEKQIFVKVGGGTFVKVGGGKVDSFAR